jgi:hypothetical protein
MTDAIKPDVRARLESLAAAWSEHLLTPPREDPLLNWNSKTTIPLPVYIETVPDSSGSPRLPLLEGRLDGPVTLDEMLGRYEPKYVDTVAEIVRKAHVQSQATGSTSLFLGIGMAEWQEGDHLFTAPVLLQPLTTFQLAAPKVAAVKGKKPRGQKGPSSLAGYALQCDPLPIVNPALVRYLTDVKGLPRDVAHVDVVRLAGSRIDSFFVEADWHGLHFAQLADSPLLRDLQNLDALERSRLVRLLARDPDVIEDFGRRWAQSPFEKDEGEPPPPNRFLVVDADSSQARAIDAILEGHSISLEGPPGTGKSQTIVNLIATLVGHGKRILFVAEKETALSVVLARLRQVQLGDLALLVAGPQPTKRQGAWKALEERREQLTRSSDIPVSEPTKELVLAADRAEDDLVRHLELMTAPRSPGGRSIAHLLHSLGTSPASPWQADLDLIETPRLLLIDQATDDLGRGFLVPRALIQKLVTVDPREGSWLATCWKEHRWCLSPWAERAEQVAQAREDLATAIEEVDSAQAWLPPLTREVVSRDGRVIPRLLALHEAAGVQTPSQRALLLQDLSPWLDGHKQLLGRKQRDRAAADAASREFGTDDPEQLRRRRELATELEGYLESIGTPNPLPLDQRWSRLSEALTARQAAQQVLSDLVGDDISAAAEVTPDELAWWSRNESRVSMVARVIDAGLGPELRHIARLSADNDATWPEIVEPLTLHWYASLLDQHRNADGLLRNFSSSDLRYGLDKYAEYDSQRVRSAPALVLRQHRNAFEETRRAPGAITAMTRLQDMTKLNQDMRSVFESDRQLFDLCTSISPCWAMSPVTISSTLPLDPDLFDVVIFDEASQLLPESAVPALLRARQVVVVGDSQQMPPAKPKPRVGGQQATQEEETYESILEALPLGDAKMRLAWHYRSLDERLIAFCNEHMYKGSMVTFPSRTDPVALELRTAATTADEVDIAVDWIAEHFRLHPDEPLGIITSSDEAIPPLDAAIKEAQRLDPEGPISRFVRSDDPETGGFLKAMKDIQGDERAAIMFVLGLGRKVAGGEIQNAFGAISYTSGTRRLNVALSRAAKRMYVTSSFDPAEYTRITNDGVRMLIDFLQYAKDQGTSLKTRSESTAAAPPPSATGCVWLDDLAARLHARGVPVVANFGEGAAVELALMDPAEPAMPVLAVETDRLATAKPGTPRDRFRLRPARLRHLNWRVEYVWALEWVENPDAIVASLYSSWESACAERRSHEAEENARRGWDEEPIDGALADIVTTDVDDELHPHSRDEVESPDSPDSSDPTTTVDPEPATDPGLITPDVRVAPDKPRPSKPESRFDGAARKAKVAERKELNAELAKWLREHGMQPNGEAWQLAKAGVRDLDQLRAAAGRDKAAREAKRRSSGDTGDGQ